MTGLELLIAQTLAGLSYASSLFLVSAGLTIIFGVTRVVNFAHGSLYMLGAYLAYTITAALPRTPALFLVGLILAALVVAVVGVVIERLILRRVYAAPEIQQLLATFGVVLIVQDAALWIWGAEELLAPRAPGMGGTFEVAGSLLPHYSVFLMLLGPAVFGALWWIFRRTDWGLRVRAATDDGEMAAALGVNRRALFTSVFALGAFLAGLGGALQIPRESVNLQMDLAIILEAFVVVVVGGLGSIGGAFLAAALIGLLHAFGVWLLPQSSLALMFVAMALVLIVRPQGLLGGALIQQPAGRHLMHPPYRPAGRALRWVWGVGAVFAVLVPFWAGDYWLVIGTEVAILALFAASLHFFMGHGGLTSFGHAAFFGLGAYSAALLAKYLAASLWAGLVAGPIVGAAAAAALAWFLLRAHGVYAAMLTLAFAQILWSGATQWVGFTGGDNGVLGLRPPQLATSRAAYYGLTIVLAAGSLWALRRAALSPFGYALRAVRDARERAQAGGIEAGAVLAAAFVAGAWFAALAGVLNAYQKGAVFPNAFAVSQSLDALVMVLAGGLQTLSGPIVGALAYHGLAVELTRSAEHWRLILGLAIVMLAVAFPQGIAGALRQRFERAP